MDLLQALRSSTREAHERLEARLDVAARCRDIASYAELLGALRMVYAPLEDAVSSCPQTAAAVPDWPRRRKTAWLDQDLAALRAQTPGPASSSSPAPMPRLTCAEDVLGCVYVMEGATMGAAIIVRELMALPRVPPHRFFTGYGAERAQRWQTFRGYAADMGSRGCDSGRVVVAAAERTFAAFDAACVRMVP